MTKTNVTTMVTTTETPTFKKARMKAVRALVAKAVKTDQRVDLLGFEGTDIPRAMIALQDLLTKEKDRHKRATEHLAYIRPMLESIRADVKDRSDYIVGLHEELADEREAHAVTCRQISEAVMKRHEADQKVKALKISFGLLNE